MKTKVTIISGFLGAGKTTLIKKLLAEAFQNEKVVLIENEYGEVSVDGGFLKEAQVEIREMYSGCICCSLVGSLYSGIREIMETIKPERILIEPSGLGRLSDVVKAVLSVGEKETTLELDTLITVVNVKRFDKMIRAFGEFYGDQIEHAETILLSRLSTATDKEITACVEELKHRNKKASIITTDWDQLTGLQILAANSRDKMREALEAELHHEHAHHHHDDHDCCPVCGGHHDHDHDHDHEHDHHHHHAADEVFDSWGLETPKKYKRETIEIALKAFSENEEFGTVLRAKGIVELTDGSWIQFDMVPGEYELRAGSADYTGRICVIGVDLNKAKLEKLF